MSRFLNVLQAGEAAKGLTFMRNLVVVALCLAFLASGLSAWVKHWLLPATVPQITAEIQSQATGRSSRTASQEAPDTQVILSRNIFGGEPRAQASEESDEDIALERIPLAKNLQNYDLVGTIVNETGQNYAIIKDKRKNEQQLFQKGDRLETASITRILRNNVIIRRDNQEQMLSIDYSARNLMQSNLGQPNGSEASQTTDTVYVDIDKGFINQTLSDLKSFMQQAQIIPYMQDGRPAGYRLNSIQPGGAFDKLGLQNGDVIVSLNGNSLESPDQLMDFRQELTSADSASLQILRNGNTVDIEYSLN